MGHCVIKVKAMEATAMTITIFRVTECVAGWSFELQEIAVMNSISKIKVASWPNRYHAREKNA